MTTSIPIPPVTPDLPNLPVVIKNWADGYVGPKGISHTVMTTYTLDPANADWKLVQIAAYEPNRRRLVIEVVDAAVMLLTSKPSKSPDPSTVAIPGTGRYLPPSVYEKEFFGPDEMWLNTVTTATRVTVTKEYC